MNKCVRWNRCDDDENKNQYGIDDVTMLRQQRQVKKWDENVNTWKSVSAVLCCHCTTFLQWIKLSNE